MSTHLARGLLLSPLALGLLAAASTANATTTRWQNIDYTPTSNDGLALLGANFDGQALIGSSALPYFEYNGTRFEISDDMRVSGPTLIEDEGVVSIMSSYEMSLGQSPLEITLYHTFADEDAQYADLGAYASHVKFDGPEGHYSFYWRIDPDLDGAAGDRVQIFSSAGGPGYWYAPSIEQEVSLKGVVEFNRFKIRLSDGPDYVHQTQLRLANPTEGSATAYVVRSSDGEFEANPLSLVSGERVQRVQLYEPIPQPIEGSDLVLWYKAEMDGSKGMVGPELYASIQANRQSVLEIDRMQSAEYPPSSTPHQGGIMSIEGAFTEAGITMNEVYYNGVLPDAMGIGSAEMDATYEANVTLQDTQDTPTQWFSWFGMARTYEMPGVLGVMYDVNYPGASSDNAYREYAYGFYDEIVATIPLLEDAGYGVQSLDQYLIWTVTHETGHAYNEHHEDYWIEENSCFYQNSAIMGYSYDVANSLHWDFGPNVTNTFLNDAEEYVRPGHGYDFMSVTGFYPYNTTNYHRFNHHWNFQFTQANCN